MAALKRLRSLKATIFGEVTVTCPHGWSPPGGGWWVVDSNRAINIGKVGRILLELQPLEEKKPLARSKADFSPNALGGIGLLENPPLSKEA